MPTGSSFGPERRLATKSDFDWVFDRPEFRIRRKAFVILARKTKQDHSRLGVIVGKRCARAAVSRNRIKRIIRETFRTADLTRAPLDIVVIAQPGAASGDRRELLGTLRESWLQLSQ